jgi:hypothetical protein
MLIFTTIKERLGHFAKAYDTNSSARKVFIIIVVICNQILTNSLVILLGVSVLASGTLLACY